MRKSGGGGGGGGGGEGEEATKWELGDLVLSWSIEDILDEGLYNNQVGKIPTVFDSVAKYFESYVAPLLEETRAELCSSLNSVSEAPHSQILCIEEAAPSSVGTSKPSYYMDVDFWENGSAAAESYKARNGDIFVLSSIKPESADDFDRYGVTYCIAMVTEVAMDEEYQKGFKVRASKSIDIEGDLNKYSFAIFLANIMSNVRIWRAIHFDTGMNRNFDIIKQVLRPRITGGGKCNFCITRGEYLFADELMSLNLNQSQTDAVKDALSTIQCEHSNFVKLIWGPPGTGKTKTVAAILWALLDMKCRTLTCAPTNVAVVGVCSRLLQLLKHFGAHNRVKGSLCSLGDVLLFGNRDRMEINDELDDVFLDYRIDQLVECFVPSSGWKHSIASMISLLEDSSSQYEMLLATTQEESIAFLEFLRKQFNVVALRLQSCLMNLWVHLPGRCFTRGNSSDVFALMDLLETFSGLLSNEDLTDDDAKKVFWKGELEAKYSTDDSRSSHVRSSARQVLDEARVKCVRLLKVLRGTLTFPHTADKSWIRDYCLRNAVLIFCTVSSSSLLHHAKIEPLDVLVVDEAAQLKECESVIPLRLDRLKHAILVGDQCQLRATVKSQVCEKAGFGKSLFERLVSLDYDKNLLNIQYRMHPSISFFPNAKFYEKEILDGPNVKDSNYNKHYKDFEFGPYAFINIADGREESDGIGNSRKNMVEVAAVLHLVGMLFKSWQNAQQKLSIGVVSPYSSQVKAIKENLGDKYDSYDGFDVRVKSIDGFQGEEDDVIILSTVRSNSKGTIGFLEDNQRTNVALTRARHCLWILGNASTLSRSGTIWAELVLDAQNRKCISNANDDASLAKVILRIKHELDQLDDLLNSDSVLLNNASWKVLFSDEFRKSFGKLKSKPLQREVLHLLLRLASGWRSKRENRHLADSFQLARIYKIRDLHLVWSIDIEKHERYIQIIRVWDLLPLTQIDKLVKRLDHIFSLYTDVYMDHCKVIRLERTVEVPMSWDVGREIIRYKKISKCGSEMTEADDSNLETLNVMENSKVSESLLLMKFYALSSGVGKHLLTARDGTELNVPFELTDQEEEIIRFPQSSFILGRSGTGKTTILTTKLVQKEQLHFVASGGHYSGRVVLSEAAVDDVEQNKDVGPSEGNFIRQIFITVSSKLCSAIRSHICRLTSFATGCDISGTTNSLGLDDISDSLDDFLDIPDNFSELPLKHYPLVITFRKFLNMLDGTVRISFFDKYFSEWGVSSSERGASKSLALQTFIQSKEVDYEKFAGSYWPHFDTDLTKKLDPSTVFTQIISHIKGGSEAGKFQEAKLEREEYIMLSNKRFSTLGSEARKRIYDIFADYENKKRMAEEFDLSDIVNHLHKQLSCDGFTGDKLDFVYIDEVQDLTMRQLALLRYVCRNFKEGFTFAGDTAQTIARGIDFRFEDIRSLFYTEFLSGSEIINQDSKEVTEFRMADTFQLNQNFRTHFGVLKLAQSIMNLLYYFFPVCVDKLSPETSLIYGEAPVLLESGNDENAIVTIFGEGRNTRGSSSGFGAEQVILVRDDCAKRQILEFVGEQALVLTIVECKGLEFQDVLLYNFFGASPLKNKWRVAYEYMKTCNILEPSTARSFPSFDEAKHNLLCSELKQLYVAITRTRQRLWICENSDEYCKPIFDYWKKLCLVQVRHLDSALVQAMQSASSAEDWKLRGIKLLNEGHFEMATMCFEKAGDEYREKWARAAGLVVTAEQVISTNREMGEAALLKAAELYEIISKPEKAAMCYIKLNDYMKAGTIYMEKCGKSRLEDAGDCFAKAECWSRAADVYSQAKCFLKCISICSKGQLFDTGLQYLQRWKEESFVDKQNYEELDKVRFTYLENCAIHYYERGEIEHMLVFVKAFQSMDRIRSFLTSKNLHDALLKVEIEMGNFLEAAMIYRSRGDILLEAEMLEKAGSFEKALQLILFHVIMNSLWISGSNGWPLKKFTGKEELLTRAKNLARKVSDSFYNSVCSEAEMLGDMPKTLSNLLRHLIEARKCQNIRLKFFTARAILDVLLRSETSKYIFDSEVVLDIEKHANEMMSQNRFSAETLVHIWNQWKAIVLEVLNHLDQPESLDKKEFVMHEEFCLEYLGVRKEDNDIFYVVLNKEASWVRNAGKVSLHKDRNHVLMNAHHYTSSARNYWTLELCSVGIMVLEKLESIIKFSPRNLLSQFSKGKVALCIYEAAKFLKEFESTPSESVKKIQAYFHLSLDFFWKIVFPYDCKDQTAENMLDIHKYRMAENLLEDLLDQNLKPKPGNDLTHGQIGRVVMLILLTGQLTDEFFNKIKGCLNKMPEWRVFLEQLKIFLDHGTSKILLISLFEKALEATFNADWVGEDDYIAPHCFMNLLECLMFLALSCQESRGKVFCTKSLLFGMLRCHGCRGYIDSCLAPIPDMQLENPVKKSLAFTAMIAKSLLSSKHDIRQWIEKSSLPLESYQPMVFQLVTILYLTYLNTGRNTLEYVELLICRNIFGDLPWAFSEKLQRVVYSRPHVCSQFISAFADALETVGNPLVVISSTGRSSTPSKISAVFISCEQIRDQEDVSAMLFPKNSRNIKDKESSPDQANISSSCSPGSEIKRNNSGNQQTSVEKCEGHQHGNVEERAVDTVKFLETVISQSKEKGTQGDFGEHLIQEMMSVCDEFRQLTERNEGADLNARWQDWQHKLQQIMNSLSTKKGFSKEAFEREGESGTETKEAEVGAVAACSTEQRKEHTEKESKKGRKKAREKRKNRGKKN